MKAVPARGTGRTTQRANFSGSAVLVCLILMTTAAVSAQTGDPAGQAVDIYADLLSKPYEYHGLGRELPEPEDIEAVRIGLFVPSRGPRAADGLSLRRGAELAVAEANSQGGANNVPFELVIRMDDFTWGSAREIVKLVYEDDVWAVVGAIGGESTHVAQQIITKARLPLIGTASTDASLTQINIPWMFRLMPDDDAIARLLATHLIEEKKFDTIVAIASTAYDSRLMGKAFERHLNDLGLSLALNLHFDPGDIDFSSQLSLIKRSGADAVVIWGEPEEGAALLEGLAAFEVFAGPGLDRPEFFRRTGASADGLTVVSLCDLDHKDPALKKFKRRFTATFGTEPDVVAAFAYDGIRLVTDAIRHAGLNRAKIRDAVAGASGFHGVTGKIFFDGSGANTALPGLKVVQAGELKVIEGGEQRSIERQRSKEISNPGCD